MEKKIKVIVCRPGEKSTVEEIDASLEGMQELVGGLIEPYYPFDDNALIVCNDEGKINGSRPSRAIYDDDNNVIDVIFGTFFICGDSGEEFESLTDEQIDTYEWQFKLPEDYIRVNGEIVAIPFDPEMFEEANV